MSRRRSSNHDDCWSFKSYYPLPCSPTHTHCHPPLHICVFISRRHVARSCRSPDSYAAHPTWFICRWPQYLPWCIRYRIFPNVVQCPLMYPLQVPVHELTTLLLSFAQGPRFLRSMASTVCHTFAHNLTIHIQIYLFFPTTRRTWYYLHLQPLQPRLSP